MSPSSLLLALLALAFLALVSEAVQPLTVVDLHQFRRVGAPVLSPDGSMAAYTLRDWNPNTNVTTTGLGLLTLSDQTTKQLTFSSGHSDSSPTFSPDGKYVAFISNRDGDSQIYTIPVDGVETQVKQISAYPVEVESVEWNSNGWLSFSARVYLDCSTQIDPLVCTAKRDVNLQNRGNSGYIFESLYVRHWNVFEDGKQSHVFVVLPEHTPMGYQLTTDPVDTMAGLSGNSPIPPFGGVEQFEISPDGTKIALTVENVEHDTAWTTGWDIYISDFSTTFGSLECLTSDTDARAENPVFSHDQRYLAYLQMDVPGDESDRRQIIVYDFQSKTKTKLASTWDRSPVALTWSCDDQFLIADVDDDGYHNLYAVTMSDRLFQLTSSGDSTAVSCLSSTSPNHNFIFWKDSMTSPAEIYALSFSISGDHISSLITVPLTTYNTDLLNSFYSSTPEQFYYTSSDGTRVQGWVMKPYGYNDASPSTQFPVAFLIHGGPEGAWGDSWSYRWNPQLWASHGYAVVMINPRGSTGFGQNFTNGVKGQWGGTPYVDLMKGIAYATAQYSFLDSSRVCACGASYGGYMINWMLGQTGNQFNCFVTHDGMFDSWAAAYDTDELWFNYYEFNGVPYENGTVYEQWNPRDYVKNWQTPTLVIHGNLDYRLSLNHGLSVFTALQRRGIPSKLLYYPTEDHHVLDSNNSVLWYDTVLDWLDQWTGNSAPQ